MTTYNVAVIVGSQAKDSINRKLAQALTKLAPSYLTFNFVDISALPMYNRDLEGSRPEVVNQFTQTLAQAQAMLIVTPEHNRSIPAVLKNAIDWGSKPMDKNVWRDKPVAITGTSPGAIGTATAQQHLRQIMGILGCAVMGGEAYVSFKPDMLDDNHNVTNEDTRNFLRAYVEKFAEFTRKLA